MQEGTSRNALVYDKAPGKRCSVVNIDLHRVAATDADLAHLSKLPDLESS